MINLRYHIVSITAVFLALGIGLTLGSTFLDRVTVDTLKAQLDDVEAQVDRTNEENDLLGSRLDDLEERDDALMAALPERLLADRLTDVPVLVLATEGTPETTVDTALGALGAAGADLAGTWWLTDRWALDDEEEVTDLARLLDLGTDDVDRLRRNGAIRVAALLTEASEAPPEDEPDPTTTTSVPIDPGTEVTTDGGDVPTGDDGVGGESTTADDEPPPAPSEPELVAALEDAGFLEYEALPGAGEGRVLLPGAAARYVVISDAASSEAGPQAFAAALLGELSADAPAPAVAAQGAVDLGSADEPVSEDLRRTTFVGPLREGELTSERISTIDDLDTGAGLAALVLAVEDLATPTIGHYGVAPGASRLLPGPVAEP